MTLDDDLTKEKKVLKQLLITAIVEFEFRTGLKITEIPITRQPKFTSFDELNFKLEVTAKL